MEEQTLYRKVHIHGEEDLPKEEGHYVVHDKQEDKVFQLGFFLEPKYDLPAIWMSIVDWYLLPVPLPNDEEIDKFIEEHPDNTGDLILGAGIAAGFKVGIKWLKSRLTDK